MAHRTTKVNNSFATIWKEEAVPAGVACASFKRGRYLDSQSTGIAWNEGRMICTSRLRPALQVKHTFVYVDNLDSSGLRRRASSAPASLMLNARSIARKPPGISSDTYKVHESRGLDVEDIAFTTDSPEDDGFSCAAGNWEIAPSDADIESMLGETLAELGCYDDVTLCTTRFDDGEVHSHLVDSGFVDSSKETYCSGHVCEGDQDETQGAPAGSAFPPCMNTSSEEASLDVSHGDDLQSGLVSSRISSVGSSDERVQDVASASALRHMLEANLRDAQDFKSERLSASDEVSPTKTPVCLSTNPTVPQLHPEIQSRLDIITQRAHTKRAAHLQVSSAWADCAAWEAYPAACLNTIPTHASAQKHPSSRESYPMQTCEGARRCQVSQESNVAERRTTVVLMNVPFGYTNSRVLSMINSKGFAGMYDFVYVPMNYGAGSGAGYVFVNLLNPGIAESFLTVFEGFSRWSVKSKNVCRVVWAAKFQGLKANIARYRNSEVMLGDVPEEYRPQVFAQGRRVQFPPPLRSTGKPRQRSVRI
eukprot:TRINITY_DN7473_c0_g1_i3.p1 TRINITY_DN7473_c0_g1~~TRINITY_DN7473_c0_g1_i3.p1  ORF type:complete len:535 (+),score=74.16 TRINITY_DN7473_c0_g1_i3:76-1680(+)